MSIERLISGGQTGVDRAALDIARELGIPAGGWCPRGRRAENGRIPDHYPLQETPSARYPERTEWNVRDADATLLLTRGRVEGGTAFTLQMARKWKRPWLVIDLSQADANGAAAWLRKHAVRTLNVAGPREGHHPGIHAEAAAFLRALLTMPDERTV